MDQFSMTFGFREPYQILGKSAMPVSAGIARNKANCFSVDAEMVRDSCRFKMDLEPALSRTVHGQVKASRLSLRLCFATSADCK